MNAKGGVRWSRAQYQAYLTKKGVSATPIRLGGKKPVVARSGARGGKNKAEAEFEAWFKYEHPSMTLLYEAVKLRIDATCWYLPDFWCPELMTFYEVKGPKIWDDAVVKFKAARALHPWAHWEMWQKRLGTWRQIRKLPGESEES